MQEELKKLAESRKAAGWLSIDSVSIKQLLALIAENERLALELKDFKWGASVEAQAGDEARAEASQLKAENESLRSKQSVLHFVFDRLPDEKGCTFIEVEDSTGASINAGQWEIRADGLAQLVVEFGDEALRKDAERYRWLREKADAADWECLSHQLTREIDRRIDAEIIKGAGQ